MLKGGIPKGINNFRLGESLLFGKERCYHTYLPNTNRAAFILYGEIVELKEKLLCRGRGVGVDSYGNRPKQREDKGMRRKAIPVLGKQDCDMETMCPVDAGIEILDASSDQLMLDVTDSDCHRGFDCI